MGIFGSIIGGIGGALLAPFTGGASIPIGAGIGNEIEDSRNAKKANEQKMGLYNKQMALAQQQFQFQQDYAKSRLQWQVEDAKKAGLHPMVAAGLSPTSFSPVSTPSIPDMSSVASDLGQNLDYAVTKAKTQKQQAEALDYMRQSNDLDLEGKRLDNELKQMEIMSMLSRLTNSGPSAPSLNPKTLLPGQNDSPQVYNAMDWARNGDYYVPTLSEAAADRTDDDPWTKRALQGGTLVEYIDNHPNSRPPIEQLSAADRKRLASGHFHWVVHPFGLRLEVIPGHEKFVQWRNKDGSVGGKLFY